MFSQKKLHFIHNFASQGICINFVNQQIYYFITLYFFIVFVGQPKSVLRRYLGPVLGSQNQTLDRSVTYFVALQLKVKHQLLNNCSFDDCTYMKILGFQRHTVNIKTALSTIVFLDPPKKFHVTFVICSWNTGRIFLYSAFLEHYFGNIPRNFIGRFFPNIPGIYHGNVPRMFHDHIFA